MHRHLCYTLGWNVLGKGFMYTCQAKTSILHKTKSNLYHNAENSEAYMVCPRKDKLVVLWIKRHINKNITSLVSKMPSTLL